MSTNYSSSSNIGFGGILFVVFLILKLCHIISWSWWWVTSPLWIPFGLFIAISTFYFVLLFIIHKKGNRKISRLSFILSKIKLKK